MERTAMANIKNHFTGTAAELVQVTSESEFSKTDHENLITIFNQSKTYKMFKRSLKGKPFGETNAQSFLEFYKKGFVTRTQYLFLLRDNNEIVAGIDLQVVDPNTATIGFWQDANKSGYITNAVIEVLKIAKEKKFKKIDAYVDLDNEKAIKVLIRTKFTYKGIVEGKTRKLKKFELDLF